MNDLERVIRNVDSYIEYKEGFTDMLIFAVKISLIFGFLYVFTHAMTVSITTLLISELPAYCQQLK